MARSARNMFVYIIDAECSWPAIKTTPNPWGVMQIVFLIRMSMLGIRRAHTINLHISPESFNEGLQLGITTGLLNLYFRKIDAGETQTLVECSFCAQAY